ncbi:MAG: transcriptional repressor [Eubacterium sp.]|nr:transcriptional repressor [Eubacterium sp.]
MKNEYKTKARGLIIEYLKKNADKRFTAGEIYDYIKTEAEGVNRTTIYRNLDRLCEQGNLMKYKEPNQDAWFYQYSQEHQHCNEHMHAQCSECGKIFHLESEFVEDFEKNLQTVYGLNLSADKTIIIGKCDDCKDK